MSAWLGGGSGPLRTSSAQASQRPRIVTRRLRRYYVEAEALLHAGDIDTALIAARRSLAELTEVGYGSGCARAHAVIAECMLRTDPATAVPHARSVIDYYAREQIYPMLRMAGLDLGRRVAEAVGTPGLFDEIDTGIDVPHLEEFPQFS